MKTDAGNYQIITERGSLTKVGEYAAEICKDRGKALIISDDTVFPLYGNTLRQSLSENGFLLCSDAVIPHGEGSKNIGTLEALLSHMAGEGLTRSDTVFALGGGVVGDIAGFSAAIYLRGIKYVQLPTTVVAAVDSSVGGKTAIDLPCGKNLAGAFYEPSLVVCDTNLLDTLPDEYFSDGMAEVIKYGFIGNVSLLTLIGDGNAVKHRDEMISMCVNDKIAVVSEDLYDNGIRQKLNFGHTVGHAVEVLSDYSISHGCAVAVGMSVITKAAVKRGMCAISVYHSLTELLKLYSLPTSIPNGFSAEALYKAVLHDKKLRGGVISLVMPTGYAKTEIIRYTLDELSEIIKDGIS